jgi:hypothetical protein
MTSQGPSRPDRHSRSRWWNLLLLLPLLLLFPPLYDFDQPRLLGMPAFYWIQFAFVAISVVCVAIVYTMTRDEPVRTDRPDRLSVDDLDRGAANKETDQ